MLSGHSCYPGIQNWVGILSCETSRGRCTLPIHGTVVGSILQKRVWAHNPDLGDTGSYRCVFPVDKAFFHTRPWYSRSLHPDSDSYCIPHPICFRGGTAFLSANTISQRQSLPGNVAPLVLEGRCTCSHLCHLYKWHRTHKGKTGIHRC